MLDLAISRIRESRMIDYHSTVVRAEEGTALVVVLEGGKETCKPAAGVNGERFVGLALNNRATPTIANAYDEVTVPASAPYTVTLPRTPTGQMAIRDMATGNAQTLDAGSTFDAGEYQIAGRVVTFPAASAGKRYRVIYRYNPTVTEVQALFGQMNLGDDVSAAIGATGVLFHADELYFTNFDPTDDWWDEDAGPLYTGAGGVLTLKTTGTKLPDTCYVVSAPNANSPFLGIRLKI